MKEKYSRKQEPNRTKDRPAPDSIVQVIMRNTCRKYSAEEKIRIVLEGLRDEQSITDLYRKEGIHPAENSHQSLVPLQLGGEIYMILTR